MLEGATLTKLQPCSRVTLQVAHSRAIKHRILQLAYNWMARKRSAVETLWGKAEELREELTKRAMDLEQLLMQQETDQIDFAIVDAVNAEYRWIENAAGRLQQLESESS